MLASARILLHGDLGLALAPSLAGGRLRAMERLSDAPALPLARLRGEVLHEPKGRGRSTLSPLRGVG